MEVKADVYGCPFYRENGNRKPAFLAELEAGLVELGAIHELCLKTGKSQSGAISL